MSSKFRNVIEQVERPFIAILLNETEEAMQAADKHRLRPSFFLERRYAAIFAAACAARSAGHVLTMASIWNHIEKHCGELDLSVSELATIALEAIPAANAITYAEDIASESRRRMVMEALAHAEALTHEGHDPVNILRDVTESLISVTAGIFPQDLPPITPAPSLLASKPPPPAELIYGVLHQGGKLMLGGTSKSHKTWGLLDLAISVAHHEPWLNFKTSRGKVLFVNLEVQDWAFASRIEAVVRAKHLSACSDNLHVWNLRGHSAPFDVLLPKIIQRTKSDGYSLVILDPIYKLYGGTDENSAGDVANLLNGIERITTETKAAVAFSAHFAKGNAASKESIDRVSGSGVFARDPDAILTMTPHETDGAFAIEATLRNFKPVQPFVVRWQFPLMRPDEDLDPKKLKQIGGRKKEYEAEEILTLLDKPMLPHVWRQKAEDQCGISRRTFFRLRDALLAEGAIEKKDGLYARSECQNAKT